MKRIVLALSALATASVASADTASFSGFQCVRNASSLPRDTVTYSSNANVDGVTNLETSSEVWVYCPLTWTSTSGYLEIASTIWGHGVVVNFRDKTATDSVSCLMTAAAGTSRYYAPQVRSCGFLRNVPGCNNPAYMSLTSLTTDLMVVPAIPDGNYRFVALACSIPAGAGYYDNLSNLSNYLLEYNAAR